MTFRREFDVATRVAIIRRASDGGGRIHCEACGVWLKSRREWEIDHVVSEGIRPPEDKKKKLAPADGWLLCKARCHRGPEGKTRADVAAIAEAKRREAAALGARGKPWGEKPPKAPLKVAAGPTGIARRYQ